MKVAFASLLLLMSSLTWGQTHSTEKLVNSWEKNSQASVISMQGGLLNLLTQEGSGNISQLDGVTLPNYSTRELQEWQNYKKYIQRNKAFDLLIQTQDSDGMLEIYVREKNDRIQSLILFSKSKEKIHVYQLDGDFSFEEFKDMDIEFDDVDYQSQFH